MPPLVLHTAIARSVADRMASTLLDDERGSLYLGATAPDIRVITRWERERTHFFDLSNFDEQSGIAGFFEAYPSLVSPEELAPPATAFIAGYLTHLQMDELWISTVYRPYFGERSGLGGGVRANILDRALQFSLDCDRRRDAQFMSEVTGAIARSELDIHVGLLDPPTLRQWHEVVLEIMGRPSEWERFRRSARRHLANGDDEGSEELLLSLPELVDEALRHLSPTRVDEFLERAAQSSLVAVKEYLA